MKHLLASQSLNCSMKFTPVSAADASLGSMGTVPRKGIPDCSARDRPPPLEKMLVHSLQLGQTYPLMFSIMPSILSPT